MADPAGHALSERLARCYTGVLHDVMRARGLADFTLPPRLRPLLPDRRLAGPAFTVLGRAAPDADPHETLLAWTGLLSKAPAGSVWVSQPNDDTVAHMGELSAETLRDKGVRGAICDGMVRDAEFLIDLGFQTWSSGFTPCDIVGRWLPEAHDVEITIGPVTIAPGDFLLGDRDGVVRLPAAEAEDLIAEAEAAIATESEIRTAIKAGMDPQQAYLQYGKF